MQQPTLSEQLRAYWHWRKRVADATKDLDGWLEVNGCATDETRSDIAETLAALQTDHLNVAFFSGSGRERSALIDALFFDYPRRRLLPSFAGLSNSCTTEMWWDAERDEAYLRLLPIETQGQGIPFAQLRTEPEHWIQYSLDPRDPQQTANRLGAITETKIVSHAEALPLGLATAQHRTDAASGTVEIPRWRHAIISFPSPLLRLGLAVLDIPGVALSDVAVDLLARAQVAVCVLTGHHEVESVGTDLWRRHLRGLGRTHPERVIVALDRIDRDLTQAEEGTATRQATQRRFAAALGIEATQVFPVSAQTALIARMRGDEVLLRRSGIETLEVQILTMLLQAKRQAQIDGFDRGLGRMVKHHRANIVARMDRAKTRLGKLEGFREKCKTLIAGMLDRTRHEQERNLRAAQHFQESRDELLAATQHSLDILDRRKMQALIAQVRSDMARSWTTVGMTDAMKGLFDELVRAMQAITQEAEHTRNLVRQLYDRFEQDFGCALTAPKVFLPRNFRVEVDLLNQEVDAFRRSPTLALAERGIVMKRFDEEMVSRARVLFEQLRAAFDTWVQDTLGPMAQTIQEHKSATERRLDQLRRLARSYDDTQQRLDEIQAQYAELARQLTALRNIHDTLYLEQIREHAASKNLRAGARRA